MTDQTPDSPIDRLAKDIGIIKQELRKINKRLDETDAFTLKLLHTLKIGEDTFDLRVARAQYNLFSGLAHTIEHSIEDYSAQLRKRRYGFEIHVVDGKSVLENAQTIQVVKNTEGGYDYSPAAFPDEINNDGTEPFTKYFNENPEVFGDRNVILINVLTEAPLPEVSENVKV